MLELIAAWNGWLNGFVWGWPTIVLLLGTGVLLTVLTGGVQFRYLGFALREVLGKITQKSDGPGSVSPFQAVATALASTVGVGNIAGVATAIAIGGPGACSGSGYPAFLGMCTKFAEIVIALHYREREQRRDARRRDVHASQAGPSVAGIHRSLPWWRSPRSASATWSRPTRSPRACARPSGCRRGHGPRPGGHHGRRDPRGHPPHRRGHRDLVPVDGRVLPGGGLVILIGFTAELPTALGLVFDGAFNGTAATGGFAGSTLMMALRYGVARGLFSNEAGLGSAPMVHAAARQIIPCVRASTASSKCLWTPSSSARRRARHACHRLLAQGATGAALAGQASRRACRAPGAISSSRQSRAVRLLDGDRLELLRRDRDRVPARHEGRGSLPVAVARLHLPWLSGIAPPGVGHRRHAERPDGPPQPAVHPALVDAASPG